MLLIAANASPAPQGQPNAGPQSTTLTVTLTASPPEVAAELERILQGIEVTVYLRREDQPPEDRRFKTFPSEGPREVTFRDVARDQRHFVAVQVQGRVIPVEELVETRDGEHEIELVFSELSVEAQPGFALYASKSRQQLAPALAAKSDPETYVGRSGSEPGDSRSGYVLKAGVGQVEFVYWPTTRFFVVLEVATSATEERTKVLDFKVRRPGISEEVKAERKKCFQPGFSGRDEGKDCFSKVILKTIKVPQQH